MSKASDKRDGDAATGGGIGSAIAQDVELTVEQAEEAAKKAAHKAAVALGLAHDQEDENPTAEERAKTPAGAASSKPSPRKPE